MQKHKCNEYRQELDSSKVNQEYRCMTPSLWDNMKKGFTEMVFLKTNDQVADIFTKAQGGEHFELNQLHLGLMRGSQVSILEFQFVS